MRIASNCGNAYARVGDKARRLFNTAVFHRLAVRDGTIVEYDLRPPFDILFGVPRFEHGSLVEVRGIEPRSRCLDSGSATSVGPGELSGRRTPEPDARRPYATQVSRAGGVAVAGGWSLIATPDPSPQAVVRADG